MKRIKFYIALWAAKAARRAMLILGRNATHLPGKLAVMLCKDFLGQLTLPKTVVAVTGTNGKTTVSNLLTSVLRTNGYTVTNNSLGSNIQAGIATALLADSNLLGRSAKDIAILEVDERSALLVLPYIKPQYLLCNNLMRDSLKRNAHTEFIQYILNRALPETTKLVLNADDLVCCGIGTENQEKIFFSLSAEKPQNNKLPFVQDIVYCPKCGGELEAEYVRYNHIGRFHCVRCGYASPAPDFAVTEINRENCVFTVSHCGKSHTYKLPNDNIANIYNACGAIALLHQIGMDSQAIVAGFDTLEIVKSRYDRFSNGELTVTLQAAKGQNPAACGRSFDYAASCPGQNKAVFILIDDKPDNTNNSESSCWLYDCDFSYLADDSIRQVIFSGPRCKDAYLRALIAGVDPVKMQQWPGFTGGAHLINTECCKDIYILHCIYLIKEANAIKDALLGSKEGA